MKNVKKFISIICCIVLIAVPVLSCTASASTSRQYPTVEVWGFMAGDIYADKNNPDSEVLWPISADFILGKVKELLPSLAKLSITRDWDKFGEESTPILAEMLGTAICDTNGEASNGSGVYFVYPEATSINKSSVVTFKYDWRLDPLQSARELNDFIEYVCAAAGTDQVCLTCHSLGGVVTLSYITLFGDARIHSIFMNSTAIFGETYNGELMNGKITFSGEGIAEYIKYTVDGSEYDNLISDIMTLLDNWKLTDFVAKFGDKIVSELEEDWLPGVLAPMFARWPAIWAMVPDDQLESAKNYIFNECLAGDGVDYSQLIAKIDSYNVVRENRIANLNKLNEDANLYVLSRYGYCSVPITPSWNKNSDGVIDTTNTSYGATVTQFGTVFADSYIADANAAYISPDHTVDASTCMFPEQTWFIKNYGHSYNAKSIDEFILTLLHYDGQATVNTFSQYPRFMTFDYATKTLVADSSAPTGAAETGFAVNVRLFFRIIKEAFAALKNLLSKK